MKQRFLQLSVTLIALGLTIFGGLSVVSAQSAVKYTGLLIRTPAEYGGFTYEFFMKPGETRCDYFIAQHDYEDEQTPKKFYIAVSDLEFDPLSGNPVFPTDSLVLDSPYSLAQWIDVDRSEVDLPYWSFEQKVNFCVTIPANAAGGSRYAHIFLSNVTVAQYLGQERIEANANAAVLGGRTGVNVLVTVDGKSQTNMSIVGLDVFDPLKQKGFLTIFESIPLYIETTLRNEGNQVLRPYGNVTIHQGDISQPSIAPLVFNQNARLLLPGSEARFENLWEEPTFQSYVVNSQTLEDGNQVKSLSLNYDFSQLTDLKLGRYIATAQVAYKNIKGEHALANAYSVVFWVIPWRIILLLVIVLALLLGVIYYRRRNYVPYIRRTKNKQKFK